VLAIRDPRGKLIPDLRGPGAAVPGWATDPFLKQRRQLGKRISVQSPLGTTILAYEVMSRRGKGGVYRALDLSVSPARLCVLKEGKRHGETDFDGRDGYWRTGHEARVLSCLSSAGIEVPEIYTKFETDGNQYLVVEFIEGQNLQSLLLSRRGEMALSEAVLYGIQAARLLHKIHATGWMWRDCKPLNLILSKEGIVRPVDFEGACPIDKPDVGLWGTDGYLPPESLKHPFGASRVSQDLFALGATLHQLLCGRLDGTYPPKPLDRLRRGVNPRVREIISALLDSDPQSRPDAKSAAQILESSR